MEIIRVIYSILFLRFPLSVGYTRHFYNVLIV